MCSQLIGPCGVPTVAVGGANWHRRRFLFGVLFLPLKEIAFAGFLVVFADISHRYRPRTERKWIPQLSIRIRGVTSIKNKQKMPKLQTLIQNYFRFFFFFSIRFLP